jgi:Mor family transcriptional regulator
MDSLERGRRDSELAAAYEAGEPIAELIERSGVSQTHLYRILRHRGVKLRAPMEGRHLTRLSAVQERAIADEYQAGAAKDALAVKYACSSSRIRRILRDARVRTRTPLEAHSRRHCVNHQAFSTITPEAAYWAGLAMADGCVSRGRDLQVSLHIQDAEHLAQLYAFVGCPDRLVARRNNMAIATIHSKRLVADLVALGIVPRKSWGARACAELAREPAFWLGMIDGDGSIFFSRAPTVSLCGSRPLMEQYSDFLAATILDGRRQRVQVRQPDGLCSVVVEGRTAQKLVALLYGASPVSLKRKRLIGERVMAWENSRPRTRVFSPSGGTGWLEKRKAWTGDELSREHHAANYRDTAAALLGKRGFFDLKAWKPSRRSSMVAFEGRIVGRPALIWVTPRWRAEVPAAVRVSDREIYVLHVCPADPDRSWLNHYTEKRTSFVPAALLRELALDNQREGAPPLDCSALRRETIRQTKVGCR